MEKSETSEFSKRLREVIRAVGVTQKQLAEKTGIHEQTISRWRNPDNRPELGSLVKISQATDCSLAYLEEGKGIPFPDGIPTGLKDIRKKSRIRKSFSMAVPGSPPDEQPLIAPPSTGQKEEGEDPDEPSLDKMVHMTTTVLGSNTVYRSALASNIRAFYKAVTGEEEMEYLRGQVEQMSEDIAEMKELMRTMAGQKPPEKKQAGNDH